MKFLINALKGIPIGIANIIPGVSGATIAVILGIFDELISSINSIVKNFFKGEWKKLGENLMFLIPIAIGAVVGIFAFSKLLEYCLNEYPFPTTYFFVGLIVGGFPLIFKSAIKEKVKIRHFSTFIIAFVVVIVLSILKNKTIENAVVTQVDAVEFIKLFLGGILAAAAMVVPGISGSFMLLLIGQYETAISGVSNMNFMVIIPIGCGAVVGILLIAKIIEFLLKRYYSYTYMGIIGLIIASIVTLVFDATLYQVMNAGLIIITILSFSVGAGISIILEKE